MRKDFLNSFNYLRAIAIIIIIAGHSIKLSGFKIETIFERVFANLILGGSHIFLFISGFLFHHIYYKNFDYLNFLKKKIRFIFFPYLFLSIIPILYFVFFSTGPHTDFIIANKDNIWSKYIYPFIWYLYTGKINFAYWYIVFIMVMFMLQPLFIWYIKLRPPRQIIILIILYMISIFIERPVNNINLIQSVVYFAPVYLFGITVSIYKSQFYHFLKNKELLILLLVILLALTQTVYYPVYGSLHKNALDPDLPDIMMIQKFFLILFLFSLLHKYEHKSFGILNSIASSSFGLFFIHPFVITLLYKSESLMHFNNPNILGIIWFGIVVCVVILISYIIAMTIKIIFKKKSRMMIGW